MEEPALSRVLDAIYDAAILPQRWNAALGQIADTFDCSYAGLIERNMRTMEGRAVAVGVDPAGQREYFEVWSKHDVLRQWKPACRAGLVETDRDILPRANLLRSDYYNGFMKPRDMHAVMRITLALEPGFRKIISMTRSVPRGDYEAHDVEQCRLLVPHLQRAARVAQHVEESHLMLASFSNVLERSDKGVLLLDRNGRLVFANNAAVRMAGERDSFSFRREQVEAFDRECNSALQNLIAGATGRSRRVDAVRGGAVQLPRKSGRPNHVAVVAPLAAGTSLLDAGPIAFVLITDPEAASARPAATMRQLFGLSAAEARVAERLILGDSPEETAAFLHVKMSTVRWHLAALYRKTGTRRQAQLVRLLMSLPGV